ncbi:hypothetical protein, partial [Mesorhizobium sp. WSM4989]|uniref:hypothetical protein n=1 Tax=Mesorhizobium sp. WSM4989 TaxID=3038541 RepID=UPI002416AD16
ACQVRLAACIVAVLLFAVMFRREAGAQVLILRTSLSRNRFPLSGDMLQLLILRMSLSRNRFPLSGDMR